ncbi:hypothetical protein ACFLU6_16250, partial [Acidobacteriota bacterium]
CKEASMYSTLRIVILVFAVFGLASLASAATCFDNTCAQNDCPNLYNTSCDTCTTSSAGTISVVITSGLECDGDGDDCDDTNCNDPDYLRVQSTIYYGNAGGPSGPRDVLVCEMLFDCGEEDIICKKCSELELTPASPPSSSVLTEFECEDLSTGTYQYVVHAVDVEGQDCPCIEDPCESACAHTCDSSWYAWAVSCCLTL